MPRMLTTQTDPFLTAEIKMLGKQIREKQAEVDALKARQRELRIRDGRATTQCRKPTLKPLFGPPQQPKRGEWTSVPTRQNYEDKDERGTQKRYMKLYGTLFPIEGRHF